MHNNSLEHPSGGAGPGMPRQAQEKSEVHQLRSPSGGANPGRSLVPAAQAQAARSRHIAALLDSCHENRSFQIRINS